MAKETLENQFKELKELVNGTSGLVYTNGFGKKTQEWNFYIFSTKHKVVDKDLGKCLTKTITYIKENREKTDDGFKMKK